MNLTGIELKGYEPLEHSGNHFVSIATISDVMVFIGNNGCGKSKLLSEVTPYPSISTDYVSGGYKKLNFTHRGDVYETWSSFEGKKGTHNFIKNDVELNDSGTSQVQQELCASHLGLTSIIKAVTNGTVNICDMVKGARKQFMLACYPSDLTFILEHHRRTASEIKGVVSNIKLMNTKKAQLEESMVSDEIFKELRGSMDSLNQLKINLDKAEAIYLGEIDRMKQHPEYNPQERLIPTTSMVDQVKKIRRANIMTRTSNPELFKVNNHDEITKLNVSVGHNHQSIERLSQEMHALRTEIDKFERMSSEVSEQKINEYKQRMVDIDTAKSQISYQVELLTENTQYLKRIDLHELQNCLTVIHSTECDILSSMAFNNNLSDLQSLHGELSSRKKEFDRLLETKRQHETRIDRYRRSRFRSGCDLVCQPKDDHNGELKLMEDEYEHMLVTIEDRGDELNKIKQQHGKLTSIVESGSGSISSVVHVEEIVGNLDIKEWIVANGGFIHILNTNPMMIYNHIIALLEHSSAKERIDSLNAEYEEVGSRLATVMETRAQTVDMMQSTIDSKRVRLKVLNVDYLRFKSEIDSIGTSVVLHKSVMSNEQKITDVCRDYDKAIVPYVINEKIKMLYGIIADIKAYAMLVEEEQVAIKTTLRSSESIKIRLEEEVLPTLVDLYEQHDKLSKLERALSPRDGIPHQYMVNFMNRVIKTTNALIKQVWNYDLGLVKLDMNKPMDFSLPIKINGKKILKDVNMISKGQKEIVNLAYTMALYIARKLGKEYPVKLDEPDSGFSEAHRSRLLGLLNDLRQKGAITQLLLVNHHHSLVSAMPTAQIICLDPNGIILPNSYNDGVILE